MNVANCRTYEIVSIFLPFFRSFSKFVCWIIALGQWRVLFLYVSCPLPV